MKIRIASALVLAGMLIAGFANAECVYPKAPASIPDGKTATEEEMVTGMKAVKEYNGQVTAYLNCLDMQMQTDISAAGAEAPRETIAQIKAINAKRHNAAVEELESHATRFNEQVKAYKGKSRDKEKKS
jgi:outer membrane murein-binding lipoprotein Lpp